MVKNVQEKLNKLERMSLKFTSWLGTPLSVIIHTLLFIGIFGLKWFGFSIDSVLLILTTAVSLEAIYLAIFIQMTVNKSMISLESVRDDVEDIQEGVEELEGDIKEISEDVEDIQLEDEKDNHVESTKALNLIEKQLQRVIMELESLKHKKVAP